MRNFLPPQTTQVMRTATRLFCIRTHHGAAGTMAPGQQLSDSVSSYQTPQARMPGCGRRDIRTRADKIPATEVLTLWRRQRIPPHLCL